jgi:TolB protein
MDLSPDGRLIAITKQEAGTTTADVWVIDWQKEVSYRLTKGDGDSIDPVWSPDGRQLAFTSFRKGNADIYVKNSNGVGGETPLVETPAAESVEDWSQDGKYLAFLVGREAFQDIYALPIESGKPGKAFPVVSGDYRKNEPQFSTDGKWLAYTSDENEPGRFQVYVISFPRGDLKQQISTEGGGQPRWSWDGKTLYYRGSNNRFMAADIRLGAAIDSSAPRELGPVPATHPTAADPTRHMWAVARDGRFLIRVPPGAGGGRGGAGAPVLAPQIASAGRSEPGAGTRGPVTSGLTTIVHWTSALPKTP